MDPLTNSDYDVGYSRGYNAAIQRAKLALENTEDFMKGYNNGYKAALEDIHTRSQRLITEH